jgi:hypothetical protein
MTDAAHRLAKSRQAIIDQIQRGEHRDTGHASQNKRRREQGHEQEHGEPKTGDPGWFANLRRAAGTWWRHHPAHMAIELATPALAVQAQAKPLRFLGIAAATGALIVIMRPWRLISITGLLVGVAKSSQLSSLLMSALSAADYQKDQPYE